LIGGISYLSASHPHSYGALWQLRERFEPEVILQAEDLPWATAFPPTWTFDERLRIGDDAELLCTGGHFAGHTMLYLPERKIVFVGDALKFEIDPSNGRCATGVSTHKAFVRRIPLTRREVERYREVFAALDFEQAWTPFDQCRNVGREEVLAFIDSQLRGRPFVDAVPL
jgi:glyoxylase-like metal-dependent hydrolase (beta-lactamase superfamily II)